MTDKERRFLDAASKGHARRLKASLDDGVNIDVKDSRGTPWNRTALMHAADKGHMEIVDLLLKAGANVNAIDKGVPLDCPGGNTALILALCSGHTLIAHQLLDAGASPRTKGGGTSVVTASAGLGDERTFRRLVALGADIRQCDGSGFTPISLAVQKGNLKIVKFLLSRGVDPNCRTPSGRPILGDAALGDRPAHLGICKALVAAGADPNNGGEDNFTPLMAACRSARQGIVRFFLSLNVRVNAMERKHSRTALDIVHELQKQPDFAPEVLRRLIRLGEIMGPPPSRLKAIEHLLRQAGAKTASELGY